MKKELDLKWRKLIFISRDYTIGEEIYGKGRYISKKIWRLNRVIKGATVIKE